MEGWEWLVAAGYLAGGVLPVIGFLRARTALSRSKTDVERRRDGYAAVLADKSLEPTAKKAKLREYLAETVTFADAASLPLIIQAHVYSHALDDLRGPARWVLGGVVLGTVASIGSLFL